VNLFMTQPKLQYPFWMLDENDNPDAEIAKEFDIERDSLIKQIETAFANVPMPRHDKVAIKYDSYSAFFGDMNGINREFGGRLWQDIPLEILSRYSEQFGVFTPEGFHYYLPAMMIAVLNYFYNTGFLPDKLPEIFSGISLLHPFSKNEHAFTAEQADVLVTFFQFIKKWWIMDKDIQTGNFPIQKSIEYWQSESKRLRN
jgi:hypothetical protein